MLSGAGGPRNSVFVLSLAVAIQIALGLILIPHSGVTGAAQSTLVAALVALSAAAMRLHRMVGTTLSARLLCTSSIPMAAAALASCLWAQLRMPSLGSLCFIALVYLAYLGGVYRLNRGTLRRILAAGAFDARPLEKGD